MFYQNIDCDSTLLPFMNALAKKDVITEEDLYPFIDEFIDTRVTDILLNVNGQASISPSDVMDDVIDVRERTVEDGYPVDYTEELGGVYTVLKKFGDPFAIWFRRIREVGMHPHISIRMNDCHCPDEATCWLRSSFFYEARDKGYMDSVASGYFRRSLNYRHEEVRRLFLDYIREQALRYDADGIELDFMRDIFCFDYAGKDKDSCVSVMNDFMRNVKDIVKEAEAKHGHKIALIVRLTRSLENSLAFGFDAVAWNKEGLVDMIIPSPRFHGSDSHIPVKEWKAALPGVKVIPCLEGRISDEWGMSYNDPAIMTAETVRGHAVHYLYEGADGVYTFNMFGQRFADERIYERDKEVQYTLGTAEEMLALPLRFITVCEDREMAPKLEGFAPFTPLPLYPEKETKKELYLATGPLPADKKRALLIGLVGGTPADLSLTLNGKPLTALSEIPMPYPASAAAKGTVCYAAPIEERADVYTVTFQKITDANLSVSWFEIDAR